MEPAPIQEPWRTNEQGRLVSTPWILWFQGLSTTAATTTSSATTTTTTGTTVVVNTVSYDLAAIISAVGLYAELGDTDSYSTAVDPAVSDAMLFSWMI